MSWMRWVVITVYITACAIPRHVSSQNRPAQHHVVPNQVLSNQLYVPQQSNQHLLPQQSNQHLLPQQSNQHLLPQQSNQHLLPQQSNHHHLPPQTNQFQGPSQAIQGGIFSLPQNLLKMLRFESIMPGRRKKRDAQSPSEWRYVIEIVKVLRNKLFSSRPINQNGPDDRQYYVVIIDSISRLSSEVIRQTHNYNSQSDIYNKIYEDTVHKSVMNSMFYDESDKKSKEVYFFTNFAQLIQLLTNYKDNKANIVSQYINSLKTKLALISKLFLEISKKINEVARNRITLSYLLENPNTLKDITIAAVDLVKEYKLFYFRNSNLEVTTQEQQILQLLLKITVEMFKPLIADNNSKMLSLLNSNRELVDHLFDHSNKHKQMSEGSQMRYRSGFEDKAQPFKAAGDKENISGDPVTIIVYVFDKNNINEFDNIAQTLPKQKVSENLLKMYLSNPEYKRVILVKGKTNGNIIATSNNEWYDMLQGKKVLIDDIYSINCNVKLTTTTSTTPSYTDDIDVKICAHFKNINLKEPVTISANFNNIKNCNLDKQFERKSTKNIELEEPTTIPYWNKKWHNFVSTTDTYWDRQSVDTISSTNTPIEWIRTYPKTESPWNIKWIDPQPTTDANWQPQWTNIDTTSQPHWHINTESPWNVKLVTETSMTETPQQKNCDNQTDPTWPIKWPNTEPITKSPWSIIKMNTDSTTETYWNRNSVDLIPTTKPPWIIKWITSSPLTEPPWIVNWTDRKSTTQLPWQKWLPEESNTVAPWSPTWPPNVESKSDVPCSTTWSPDTLSKINNPWTTWQNNEPTTDSYWDRKSVDIISSTISPNPIKWINTYPNTESSWNIKWNDEKPNSDPWNIHGQNIYQTTESYWNRKPVDTFPSTKAPSSVKWISRYPKTESPWNIQRIDTKPTTDASWQPQWSNVEPTTQLPWNIVNTGSPWNIKWIDPQPTASDVWQQNWVNRTDSPSEKWIGEKLNTPWQPTWQPYEVPKTDASWPSTWKSNLIPEKSDNPWNMKWQNNDLTTKSYWDRKYIDTNFSTKSPSSVKWINTYPNKENTSNIKWIDPNPTTNDKWEPNWRNIQTSSQSPWNIKWVDKKPSKESSTEVPNLIKWISRYPSTESPWSIKWTDPKPSTTSDLWNIRWQNIDQTTESYWNKKSVDTYGSTKVPSPIKWISTYPNTESPWKIKWSDIKPTTRDPWQRFRKNRTELTPTKWVIGEPNIDNSWPPTWPSYRVPKTDRPWNVKWQDIEVTTESYWDHMSVDAIYSTKAPSTIKWISINPKNESPWNIKWIATKPTTDASWQPQWSHVKPTSQLPWNVVNTESPWNINWIDKTTSTESPWHFGINNKNTHTKIPYPEYINKHSETETTTDATWQLQWQNGEPISQPPWYIKRIETDQKTESPWNINWFNSYSSSESPQIYSTIIPLIKNNPKVIWIAELQGIPYGMDMNAFPVENYFNLNCNSYNRYLRPLKSNDNLNSNTTDLKTYMLLYSERVFLLFVTTTRDDQSGQISTKYSIKDITCRITLPSCIKFDKLYLQDITIESIVSNKLKPIIKEINNINISDPNNNCKKMTENYDWVENDFKPILQNNENVKQILYPDEAPSKATVGWQYVPNLKDDHPFNINSCYTSNCFKNFMYCSNGRCFWNSLKCSYGSCSYGIVTCNGNNCFKSKKDCSVEDCLKHFNPETCTDGFPKVDVPESVYCPNCRRTGNLRNSNYCVGGLCFAKNKNKPHEFLSTLKQ